MSFLFCVGVGYCGAGNGRQWVVPPPVSSVMRFFGIVIIGRFVSGYGPFPSAFAADSLEDDAFAEDVKIIGDVLGILQLVE
jgi:hypothetical protein